MTQLYVGLKKVLRKSPPKRAQIVLVTVSRHFALLCFFQFNGLFVSVPEMEDNSFVWHYCCEFYE